MKKSFIFLLFVSVVALAAMNIYQNNHKLALSDITLANVEALANETGGGESGGSTGIIGRCTSNLASYGECEYKCWYCSTVWRPSTRVPNAVATNLSGNCGKCGNLAF